MSRQALATRIPSPAISRWRWSPNWHARCGVHVGAAPAQAYHSVDPDRDASAASPPDATMDVWTLESDAVSIVGRRELRRHIPS